MNAILGDADRGAEASVGADFVLEPRHGVGANAFYASQVLCAGVGSIDLAVFDDGLRLGGPNARQLGQQLNTGLIDVDGRNGGAFRSEGRMGQAEPGDTKPDQRHEREPMEPATMDSAVSGRRAVMDRRVVVECWHERRPVVVGNGRPSAVCQQ